MTSTDGLEYANEFNRRRSGFPLPKGEGPRVRGKETSKLSGVPKTEMNLMTALEQAGRQGSSEAPFPLTPCLRRGRGRQATLSLRERETRLAVLGANASPFVFGSKSSKEKGFSLVEMIVAVGVLAMIIVGLLAMFSQTSRTLRASNNQTDVLETGRVLTEMLVREMQQANAAGLTNSMNFYATRITGANPLSQQLPGGGTWNSDLEAVYFLVPMNTEWQAIGYFIDPANTGVGTLYRYFNKGGLEAVPGFFADFTNQVASLPNSPRMRRVAEGVVHMEVHVYDTNGVRPTVSSPTMVVDNNVAAYFERTLPAFVEVEMGVLEPYIVEQMRGMTPANARIYLENERRTARVHLFRQRIPIQSALAQ